MAKQILIVDDTMSIGRFLQAALMTLDAGLKIVVVPSGEEAILAAGSQGADLLVADINLPGISGLELSKKIKNRHPHTQIILMSGMSDYPLQSSADEVGAVAFFPKPLDTELFLEAARRCLGMSAPVQAETGNGTPSSAESLSQRLIGLRQRLDAVGVLLLDERGRVVAQAGDQPHDDFFEQWVGPLLSASSAGTRVCRLLGDASPVSVMVFRGEQIDLLLAPVGLFTLVLALKIDSRHAARTALAFEETLNTQQELAAILGEMGVAVQAVDVPLVMETSAETPSESAPASAEQEETSEAQMEGLAAIFEKAPGDLDAAEDFWDALAEPASIAPADPDVLTFEQARQLGLAPD